MILVFAYHHYRHTLTMCYLHDDEVNWQEGLISVSIFKSLKLLLIAVFSSVSPVNTKTLIIFKPLKFCAALGFALSNGPHICILMTLYDICLLPALYFDEILHVWDFESHMQIADRSVAH